MKYLRLYTTVGREVTTFLDFDVPSGTKTFKVYLDDVEKSSATVSVADNGGYLNLPADLFAEVGTLPVRVDMKVNSESFKTLAEGSVVVKSAPVSASVVIPQKGDQGPPGGILVPVHYYGNGDLYYDAFPEAFPTTGISVQMWNYGDEESPYWYATVRIHDEDLANKFSNQGWSAYQYVYLTTNHGTFVINLDDWDWGYISGPFSEIGTPPVAGETVSINMQGSRGYDGQQGAPGTPGTFASTQPGQIVITSPDAGTTALIAKGAAGQTNNIQEWRNSADSIVAYIWRDGLISGNGAALVGTYGQTRSTIRSYNTGGGDSTASVRVFEGYNSSNAVTSWISTAGYIGASGIFTVDSDQKMSFIGGSRINFWTPGIWMDKPGSGILFKSADDTKNRTVSLSNDGTFNLPARATSPSWQTGNTDALIGVLAPNGGSRTTIYGSGRLSVLMNDVNGGTGWGAAVPLSVFHDGGFTSPEVAATGNLIQATLGASDRFYLTKAGDMELPTASTGLILKSPNGTRYKITVTNGGTLSVSAA